VSDVLAQLRAATSPAHQQLEAVLNLLDARINLQDYRNILARFHGFWRAWQPLAGGLMNDPAFTLPRQRLYLLENDLAALGMPPAAAQALPLCPMPGLTDAAAALGSFYVMEGSTLGGRVIEKTLLPRLGLTRDSGGSYFAGYGGRTGPMWRDFLDRLAAAPLADAAQITFGAAATFTSLTSWFADKPLHCPPMHCPPAAA
jgi:heme oxygenase